MSGFVESTTPNSCRTFQATIDGYENKNIVLVILAFCTMWKKTTSIIIMETLAIWWWIYPIQHPFRNFIFKSLKLLWISLTGKNCIVESLCDEAISACVFSTQNAINTPKTPLLLTPSKMWNEIIYAFFYPFFLKFQWLHSWSLGMNKYFNDKLYNGCNFLSVLRLDGISPLCPVKAEE